MLALLLSALLSVPTVRAQTLSSDGSLNWGVSSTGPSTSTVVGTSLVILGAASGLALTLTPPGAVAGAGAATLALTGRALSVTAATVGPIAAAALQRMAAAGALTGAALALASLMSSDARYDRTTGTFVVSDNSTRNPYPSSSYAGAGLVNGTTVYGDPAYVCAVYSAQQPGVKTTYNYYTTGSSTYSCWVTRSDNGNQFSWSVQRYTTGCGAGDSASGGMCYPAGTKPGDPVPTKPATLDQISSSLQQPVALAKVWDAFGCGPKITTFRDTASADDPCAQIVGAPGAGGRTWTPVTVPNGGAVTFPGKTETTVDGNGKVVGTRTTVPTAQVAANTNQATMGASPVMVTPGQTVTTTTTNADGSTTTTTTTTTNPAQSTPQQTDGTATFSAGDATLYTKKSRTWNDVLLSFQNSLKAAPWYQAASNFFTVSISASQCPRWSMPANKWMPALDAGQFVCSSTMGGLYQLGGAVVMIVAAWAAFRIAFL